MDDTTLLLIATGVVFVLGAALAGAWQLRREARRRQAVFAARWGGDPAALVAGVDAEERAVLQRIRVTQGDEAAAIRLRRLDPDVPFAAHLAAVRTLGQHPDPRPGAAAL